MRGKTTNNRAIKSGEGAQDQVVEELVAKPLKRRVEKSRVTARGKNYTMDLRVHSPASLGYYGIEGIETAPALVSLCKVKGLDVIAVTDFFSGEFVDQVVSAARDAALIVIPGVDIRCSLNHCNDVILTCLFPENFGTSEIEQFLREVEVPVSARGNKNFVSPASFDKIIKLVEDKGGVIIPSKMDHTPNRLSVLSMLVEKYGFRTFDLAYADSLQIFKQRWSKVKFQLYSFSEANSLAQVGSRTARVKLPELGFDAIKGLVAREQVALLADGESTGGTASRT